MGKGKSKIAKIKDAVKKIEKVSRAVNTISRAPLKSLGGAVGSKMGSKRIGQDVGAFFGRIAGTGDYTVSSNTLGNRGFATDAVPQFAGKTGAVRVRHREYLGDVIASSNAGAFLNTSYSINPGLFSTFPWLASFATQFDEWRPNGIVFVYKTTSSTYSGTASLGTVILATDYDVSDAKYGTKQEMENSSFAVSCNVAMSVMHPIECKVNERMSNVLFTRSGSVTDSLRFYDLGNFQIATQGCAANQNCGELWMTYDITFYKTQLYGGIGGGGILSSQYSITGWANATPFGTSRTLSSRSTLTSLTVTGTTVVFPLSCVGGTFIVALASIGTGVTIVDPGFSYTNGATDVSTQTAGYTGFLNTLAAGISSAGTSVSTAFTMTTVFINQPTTSGTLPTVTIGAAGTWPSAPTYTALCVTQAPRFGY